MPKCVTLLSGGADSATVLAIAVAQAWEVYALTVDYGQRHSAELAAAAGLAKQFGAKEHRVVRVQLDAIGGSALTAEIDVPKDRPHEEMTDIPITYVPARNTTFLAIALGYAEVVGATDIFVGVNAVDYSGYPDCRPEFLAAFEALANVATKAGVEGAHFKIHAPLLHLTKAEILRQGQALGVDYGKTHSCYDPVNGRACGRCDSCRIRVVAFAELGQTDPALAS